MHSSRTIAIVVGVLSLLMVVVGMWGAKRYVTVLPADYFLRPPPQRTLPVRIARTVLGVVLVAAGIAMLLLPGQGLLTIVIGLLVLDLPIQHKVARWLIARPALHRVIDGWRERAGRPPLEMPAEPRSS